MTRPILLVFVLASAAFGQATVSLNGQGYTLQPHPRVFFNSSIQSRIQDPDGTGPRVAPKVSSANPPWIGTQWIVNSNGLSTQYDDVNYQNAYRGGVEAAAAAIQWYSDNTQTAAGAIALSMLNNIEQYVPFLCDEAQSECVLNGGTGYGITSYGAAYWLPNWIFAYELIRGQMTTAQQQAFADKILNDRAEWGGVDGAPSTNCTNPTGVSTVNVTVSSGIITASSALFGAGNPIQAGYWISMDSDGAAGYNYGKIASVTDSTHAAVSAGDAANFNAYNGVLAYRRNTWVAGDCGFLWHIKHDEWTAAAISDSTNYPPSGAQNGTAYYHNLVISSIWGMLPALLSVADDDVNYSFRASLEITALYNAWYTNVYQSMNETYYTGRHQTGSTYGIWRATLFYPGIAFAVQNSTVSGPSVTSGVWAKNILYHYFMNWLPGSPGNEPQWGQDFSSGPNFDVNGYGLPGVAELITMYPTSNEGEWANWWMQNVLSGYSFQNTPGTNLSWSPYYYAWQYHNYGEYPFLYAWTDPAYATTNLAMAPTAAALSVSDSGTTPTSMLISRTGYTSYLDTLVNLEAPSEYAQDHNLAQGGWTPGNYKIYKGYFLLGSDNGGNGQWMSASSAVGNGGGSLSMYMEIGGAYNLTNGHSAPYIVSLMPRVDTDGTNNRFAYAMVDSTQSYVAGVGATRVHRHLVDFKVGQQFIVVYDDVVTSSGQLKRTYLHYLNNNMGLPGQGLTTFDSASSSVSSIFNGFTGTDSAELLTQVLAPAGSNTVYTYLDNPDGTYAGGNGDSFRVNVCASSTGTSCDSSNTEAEFVVVHMPAAGTGNTMPSTAMLTTVDANHRAVQVGGISPKVAVFPLGGSTYESAAFTSTHSGTAEYLVAGLVAGTYNVTVSGAPVASNIAVNPNDNTLYFSSTSGSVLVSEASLGSVAQVPNVVGNTQAAAAIAITGAGLLVGTVTTAASSTVAAGGVISESPLAGTTLTAGLAVNLVLSSGTGAIVTFIGSDITTEGNWIGKYGSGGYSLAAAGTSIPSYASFAVQNQLNYTWAASTTDVRALETAGGAGRIAATWYSGSSFSLSVNFTDGNSHELALYAVDWDDRGRSETIQITDANTQAVLDTETVSGFDGGTYAVWNISGSVNVSVTAITGPNAVISGVFWGGGGASTGQPAGENFVTAFALNQPALRQNFSGWVGMEFTVGGEALTVTALGRVCIAGNSAIHAVELINAATGSALSGGSASVNMSGCTGGQFVYSPLAESITLQPNTAYYLASLETSGGDQWYDYGDILSTTVAAVNNAIYSYDGATWIPLSGANTSYVPPSFQYSVGGTGGTVSQPGITQQPQSETVGAGAAATFSVNAVGGDLAYQWQSALPGSSTFTPINGATGSSYTASSTILEQSGTQYLCVVSNTAGSISSSAATLTVVASIPTANYVTSATLGTIRNNFTGWVGMSIAVGSSPMTVTALGRIFAPGNMGSHTVQIVNASTNQTISGGSVSVSMSGGTAGSFVYASLPAAVTLDANSTYYIVSQETSGGDQWYDFNTTIATTNVAAAKTSVYSYDGATYIVIGPPNQSYGPVNLVYNTGETQPGITQQPQSETVGAGAAATFSVNAVGGDLAYQWQSALPGSSTFTPINGATGSSYTASSTILEQSGTQYLCVVSNTAGSISSNAATLTVVANLPTASYVTSTELGAIRNNFTGWVGMSIAVGSSPMTVTALGRIFAPGNMGSHTVQIVSASTNQAISGGSVSVSMSGGTAGSFVYASLPAAVTLDANSTYHIVSEETSGGDQWYDFNTTIATTSVAAAKTSVYSYDGATYIVIGPPNQSYGPVNLEYVTQ